MTSYVEKPEGAPGRTRRARPHDPEKARERYVKRVERGGKMVRVWRNNPKRPSDVVAAERAAQAIRGEEMREAARRRAMPWKYNEKPDSAPETTARMRAFDAQVALAKQHAAAYAAAQNGNKNPEN